MKAQVVFRAREYFSIRARLRNIEKAHAISETACYQELEVNFSDASTGLQGARLELESHRDRHVTAN